MTVQDINIIIAIWGKDIFALKGETTRNKTIPVVEDFVQVPKEQIKHQRYITMTADIFLVDTIPLFLTLRRKISFTMVHHLADRKDKTIYTAFNEVYIYYTKRGFEIITLHTDGEIANLQAMIIEHMPGGTTMNLTSSNENVPEIERRIRVAKEREICLRHSLPFNSIPRLPLIHIVFVSVKMLNYFPIKVGVSTVYSPKTIMSIDTLHYNRHLSLKIGQYLQFHDEDTPINIQAARTKSSICLVPSGNTKGGFKFISLHSSNKITIRN